MNDIGQVEDDHFRAFLSSLLSALEISDTYLSIALSIQSSATSPHKFKSGTSDGLSLPSPFREAGLDPKWAVAIDCKYGALISKENWTYVSMSKHYHLVIFHCTFRAKQLENIGSKFLSKERCTLRGDLQQGK